MLPEIRGFPACHPRSFILQMNTTSEQSMLACCMLPLEWLYDLHMACDMILVENSIAPAVTPISDTLHITTYLLSYHPRPNTWLWSVAAFFSTSYVFFRDSISQEVQELLGRDFGF